MMLRRGLLSEDQDVRYDLPPYLHEGKTSGMIRRLVCWSTVLEWLPMVDPEEDFVDRLRSGKKRRKK